MDVWHVLTGTKVWFLFAETIANVYLHKLEYHPLPQLEGRNNLASRCASAHFWNV
jgi:hypothetical protein